MEKFIVAIDGPAGSGKSTISKLLAKRLEGFTYLDTGAMYRMIALNCLNNNVDLTDSNAVNEILLKSKIDIHREKFYLNSEDVSSAIRTKEVTALVSKVAALKVIREKLVDLQREISKGKKVIIDGRDIGTVVFPNAELKIFLIASPEERAKRRVKDYENKGIESNFEEVLAEIIKRDKMDSERKESPLKKADDAEELDTSFLNIEEVVSILEKKIEEKI